MKTESKQVDFIERNIGDSILNSSTVEDNINIDYNLIGIDSTAVESTIESSGSNITLFRVENDKEYPILIDEALERAGIGKFNYLLLFAIGFAVFLTSFIQNLLSFNFRDIRCSLKPKDQHILDCNDITHYLMIFGCIIFGTLGDIISRKLMLCLTLYLNSFICIFFGFSMKWTKYTYLKGLFAFCNSGIYILSITYIAEFQNNGIRASMVSSIYFFWVIGALMATALYNTWKWAIFHCTLLFFLSGIFLYFFPDPPSFLFDRKRSLKTLISLRQIYEYNNTNDNSLQTTYRIKQEKNTEVIPASSLKSLLGYFYQYRCFIILLISEFAIMFSYYTLSYWFQNLVVWYDPFYPTEKNNFEHLPSNCYNARKAYDRFTSQYATKYERENKQLDFCPKVYSPYRDNPYGNTMYCTFVSVPAIILLVISLDIFGAKAFIAFSHVIASILIASSQYYMKELYLHSVFISFYQTLCLVSHISTQYLAINLIPSCIRILGLGLITTAGQLGAILGSYGWAIILVNSCTNVIIFLMVLVCGMYSIYLYLKMSSSSIK